MKVVSSLGNRVGLCLCGLTVKRFVVCNRAGFVSIDMVVFGNNLG